MFQRAMPRRFYLVVFVTLLVALAATGLYLRHRAIEAAAAADCEMLAPPPKPVAPPPDLPGFALDAGCGAAPAHTPSPGPSPAPAKPPVPAAR